MSVSPFGVGTDIGGRFRLAKPLATGGMAEAFLAWDAFEHKPVVVKIPRRGLLDDELFIARFSREIEALRMLRHPHIVPLIATGLHGNAPYYVMPLMAGGSLAERAVRPLGSKHRAEVGASLKHWLPAIAAALDHAHEQGFVHRDVKPANILFDATRTPFMCDFGIVKVTEEDLSKDETLTRTNIALGTLFYMAPERFNATAELTGRADQYSLAISVYEVLAGHRPFLGQTHHVAVEHLTKPPPRLRTRNGESVPEFVWTSLNKALSKDPADRFDTCTAFAAAILCDVPPVQQVDDSVELMCPACRRLIRLTVALAGKRGHCSRCRASVLIGPRCEWLWPIDLPVAGESVAAEPTNSMTTLIGFSEQGWRWKKNALAGVGAAIVFAGLFARLPAGGDPKAPGAGSDAMLTPAEAPPGVSPKPVNEVAGPELAIDTVTDAALPERRVYNEPQAPPPAIGGDVREPDNNHMAPHPADQDESARDDSFEADAGNEIPNDGLGLATTAVAATERLAATEERGEKLSATVVEAAPVFPNHKVNDMYWVLVADPGNAPDIRGAGVVDRPYLIGRYEVTNEEYCAFLNGSDVGRRSLRGVAEGPIRPDNPKTAQDWDRGIIRFRDAHGDQFRYQTAPMMHDKPVINLRWSDAARYANWLHNGGHDGADTETGAYDLSGGADQDGIVCPASPTARVWIPHFDEWYKAAFSKLAEGKCIGYWGYPTASDKQPTAVRADTLGVGLGWERSGSNLANISRLSRRTEKPPVGTKLAEWRNNGAPTSVGSNGMPSDFGVFDMAGNASELVIDQTAATTTAIAIGGDYTNRPEAGFFSAVEVVDSRPRRGLATSTGLRLACEANPAIPIKPAREHRPLGRMDDALEALQRGLGYVANTPPDNFKEKECRKAWHELRRISQAGFTDDVAATVREASQLLQKVDLEWRQKQSLMRGVSDMESLGLMTWLKGLFGERVVREFSNHDQREIAIRFIDAYTKHQDAARVLDKTCETLRRGLRAP